MIKIKIPRRKLLSIRFNKDLTEKCADPAAKFILSLPLGGYEDITIKDTSTESIRDTLAALLLPLNVYHKDDIRVLTKSVSSFNASFSYNINSDTRKFFPTLFVKDSKYFCEDLDYASSTIASRLSLDFPYVSYKSLFNTIPTKYHSILENIYKSCVSDGAQLSPFFYFTCVSNKFGSFAKEFSHFSYLLKGETEYISISNATSGLANAGARHVPSNVHRISSSFEELDKPQGKLSDRYKGLKKEKECTWLRQRKDISGASFISPHFQFSYYHINRSYPYPYDDVPGGPYDPAYREYESRRSLLRTPNMKQFSIDGTLNKYQGYFPVNFLFPAYESTGKSLTKLNSLLAVTQDFKITKFSTLKIKDKEHRIKQSLSDLYTKVSKTINKNLRAIFGSMSNIYFEYDKNRIYGNGTTFDSDALRAVVDSSACHGTSNHILNISPPSSSEVILGDYTKEELHTKLTELSNLDAKNGYIPKEYRSRDVLESLNPESFRKMSLSYSSAYCFLESLLLSDKVKKLPIKLTKPDSEDSKYKVKLLTLYLYSIKFLTMYLGSLPGSRTLKSRAERYNETKIIALMLSRYMPKIGSHYLDAEFFKVNLLLEGSKLTELLSKVSDETLLSRPIVCPERILKKKSNKKSGAQAVISDTQIEAAFTTGLTGFKGSYIKCKKL